MKNKENLKTLNFKVEEKLLNKVNYYRSVDLKGPRSQAEFLIEALEEKCQRTRRLRGGSLLLSIPNPINFKLSDEQKTEIVLKLAECTNDLLKISPYMSFGIDEILVYAKEILITMPEEKRKELKQRFHTDLKIEDEL